MKRLALILCIFLAASRLKALDLWLYPEAADKNALFAGSLVSLTFQGGLGINFLPEFYLDYVLPVGLPFSIGVSTRALERDFTSVAFRPGYHIDLSSEALDLYVLFPFEFYFRGRDILLEYGPRAGFRVLVGRFFCITAETGYKLKNLSFGLAIKLN